MILSILIDSYFVNEFEVRHSLCICELSAAAINDCGW